MQFFFRLFTLIFLNAAGWVYAADMPDGVQASTVRVLVYKNEQVQASSTGIVIQENTVLTTADILDHGRRVVVVNSDGAELGASVSDKNTKANVALLNVAGMLSPALVLASQPISAGRRVTAIAYLSENNSSARLQALEGSVSATDRFAESTGKLLMHNALITRSGFGGALLNNCGELVGMNVPGPATGLAFLKPYPDDPEGVVYALGLERLRSILQQKKINVTVAEAECLTAEAQQTLEAAQARKDAEQARKDAEQARKDAEQARKEAEQVKKETAQRKQQAEAEKNRIREETRKKEEELKTQLTREQERIKEKDEQAKALEEKLQLEREEKEKTVKKKTRLEQQQQEDRERQQQFLIAAGIATLLAAGIVLYLLSRRKKAVLVARIEAQRAREEAEKTNSALDAERARKQHLLNLPDFLLEGTTPEGEEIALKISGQSIGESDQGIIIGRNPAQSGTIINSEEVSREHFRFLFVGDQLMIEDLDTTNGTRINGDLLTANRPEVIFPGASIEIGQLRLVLKAV